MGWWEWNGMRSCCVPAWLAFAVTEPNRTEPGRTEGWDGWHAGFMDESHLEEEEKKKKTDGMMIPHFLLLGAVVVLVVVFGSHAVLLLYHTPPLHGMAWHCAYYYILSASSFWGSFVCLSSCLGRLFWLFDRGLGVRAGGLRGGLKRGGLLLAAAAAAARHAPCYGMMTIQTTTTIAGPLLGV